MPKNRYYSRPNSCIVKSFVIICSVVCLALDALAFGGGSKSTMFDEVWEKGVTSLGIYWGGQDPVNITFTNCDSSTQVSDNGVCKNICGELTAFDSTCQTCTVEKKQAVIRNKENATCGTGNNWSCYGGTCVDPCTLDPHTDTTCTTYSAKNGKCAPVYKDGVSCGTDKSCYEGACLCNASFNLDSNSDSKYIYASCTDTSGTHYKTTGCNSSAGFDWNNNQTECVSKCDLDTTHNKICNTCSIVDGNPKFTAQNDNQTCGTNMICNNGDCLCDITYFPETTQPDATKYTFESCSDAQGKRYKTTGCTSLYKWEDDDCIDPCEGQTVSACQKCVAVNGEATFVVDNTATCEGTCVDGECIPSSDPTSPSPDCSAATPAACKTEEECIELEGDFEWDGTQCVSIGDGGNEEPEQTCSTDTMRECYDCSVESGELIFTPNEEICGFNMTCNQGACLCDTDFTLDNNSDQKYTYAKCQDTNGIHYKIKDCTDGYKWDDDEEDCIAVQSCDDTYDLTEDDQEDNFTYASCWDNTDSEYRYKITGCATGYTGDDCDECAPTYTKISDSCIIYRQLSGNSCTSNEQCASGYFCSVPGPEQCFDQATKNKFAELGGVSYQGVCSPLGDSKTVGKYTTTTTYKGMSWWAANNWCDRKGLVLAPAPTDGYVQRIIDDPDSEAVGEKLINDAKDGIKSLWAAMGVNIQWNADEDLEEPTFKTLTMALVQQYLEMLWPTPSSATEETAPSLQVLEEEPAAWLFKQKILQLLKHAKNVAGDCLIAALSGGSMGDTAACEAVEKEYQEAFAVLTEIASEQAIEIAKIDPFIHDGSELSSYWLNHTNNKTGSDPCVRYSIMTMKEEGQVMLAQIHQTENANPLDGHLSATSVPPEIWNDVNKLDQYTIWFEEIDDADSDFNVVDSEAFITNESGWDGTRPLCVAK